jgi:hypothetical protein
MICTAKMLKLLVKIMELDVREEFGDQVLAAWTENEMLKVINAMHIYLDQPTKKQ